MSPQGGSGAIKSRHMNSCFKPLHSTSYSQSNGTTLCVCVFVEGDLEEDWLELITSREQQLSGTKAAVSSHSSVTKLPTPAADGVSCSQLDPSQAHDVISDGGDHNSDDDEELNE